MNNWIWAKLLRFLTKRCQHNPNYVTADILEGDCGPTHVFWCRGCGSYKRYDDINPEMVVENDEWTNPRPDWWYSEATNPIDQLAEATNEEDGHL